MHGIPCPKCGGTRWRVTNTWRLPGCVRRRRVCLRCGRPISTVEQTGTLASLGRRAS